MKSFDENLTLEKINKYGIEIYQDKRFFKFGADAFALAKFTENFVKHKNIAYLDLCSGTGIIPIIVEKKMDLSNISAIEFNEYAFNILEENILKNQSKIKAYKMDLRDWQGQIKRESLDLISVNPPYMKALHGLKTNSKNKDLAKIESFDNFLDILFYNCFYMLKDQASLCMVHRVERLVDLLQLSRKNKLEPKSIQFIRNKSSKKASLVMIQFVKNAKAFLKMMDDYIVE